MALLLNMVTALHGSLAAQLVRCPLIVHLMKEIHVADGKWETLKTSNKEHGIILGDILNINSVGY